MSQVPSNAMNAVFVKSQDIDEEAPIVCGYDFNQPMDFDKLFSTYFTTGFQANHLGKAMDIINEMLRWRLSDVPQTPEEIAEELALEPELRTDRKNTKATIFLGYTSNMVSCGVREMIRYLCQHKLIDCIVTTGGGIEEDFIKCMAPTYCSDFNADGATLRSKGMNRIGNLMIPNQNYCSFEDFVLPILDKLVDEQKDRDHPWTPSDVIHRLGKEIDNPESIYYWCYKNDIPVFCPAITDGSLGDMMFFHSFNKPGLIIDILEDLRRINNMAIAAHKTGCVILGGGVIKHHICNANLMRNGTDWAVYINTGHEYDGSDAGASPDEAVSWGKISVGAKSIKVHSEATLVFPIIMSQTFYKYVEEQKKMKAEEEQKE